jgi:hypothetical protein
MVHGGIGVSANLLYGFERFILQSARSASSTEPAMGQPCALAAHRDGHGGEGTSPCRISGLSPGPAGTCPSVPIGHLQRHAPGYGFRLTPDQARRIARP